MPLKITLLLLAFQISIYLPGMAQSAQVLKETGGPWHGKQRAARYSTDGSAFIIKNGTRRFNRALYGSNTGFRVEAGDLPQFALYMPGMGGSLKFGLIRKEKSKWLIEADQITARYQHGVMLYEIEDKLLGKGRMQLEVVAMAEGEGILVKVEFQNVKPGLELFWAFGGATGKRFNRDGDIGADPESCFYLKPEYCGDNIFFLQDQGFDLQYGSGKVLTESERYEIQHVYSEKPTGEDFGNKKRLRGVVPPESLMKLADANHQNSPRSLFDSKSGLAPVVAGNVAIVEGKSFWFSIYNPAEADSLDYAALPMLFKKAETARTELASRVHLETPDLQINPMGWALAFAADAIYEHPTYLHGAIAWRMRLNGWRGAYVADPLGWHDRARAHLDAYALSQLTQPETGPVTPDTVLNFARQKEVLGTALFSSGYICRNPGGDFRAHHYDMNLVLIDQLLRHLRWTGDLEYARKMWPVLKRHLAWEKRCFDGDNDGLYDAYCSIWASDALEYSGGEVTHSSAYNYFANDMAAQLADMIGEQPESYRQEADRILKQINAQLWMPDLGRYAEFRDVLGNQKQHPAAGLWTVYHAIDSEISDPFQAYQALRYIDTEIPHIPIVAKGAPDSMFTLSTTNWMPYTWSVNNVALAEVLHTALAYWQGGRKDAAYRLWKSAMVESMYLGASPGSIQQLSFYDAFRGELYRDFADPVGMTARSLVEGLFGIRPNVLNRVLTIQPGFPDDWEYAALKIPDVSFRMEHSGNTDRYHLEVSLPKPMELRFRVNARTAEIHAIRVNGQKVKYSKTEIGIGRPVLEITAAPANKYFIEIEWLDGALEVPELTAVFQTNGFLDLQLKTAELLDVYDPQLVFQKSERKNRSLWARLSESTGPHTVFVKLQQGGFQWWAPLNFEIRPEVEVLALENQDSSSLKFKIRNNTNESRRFFIITDKNDFPVPEDRPLEVPGDGGLSETLLFRSPHLISGSNPIYLKWNTGYAPNSNYKYNFVKTVTNWNIPIPAQTKLETIPIADYFNDRVSNIFQHKYKSPRVPYPTVQIPLQGVGNWCYPKVMPNVDDSGLRATAGAEGIIKLPQGIPFATPGPGTSNNIAFTSLWDNFPDTLSIPLSGSARHMYLLLAGTTNAMQSRFDNGLIEVQYEDGTTEKLVLRNPDTWWPIEQDYFFDGFAFACDAPVPPRVHLKTGLVPTDFKNHVSIKGYSDRVIDGGAATVLDLPLNSDKKLKSLTLKTLANEVIIGLMAITLVR